MLNTDCPRETIQVKAYIVRYFIQSTYTLCSRLNPSCNCDVFISFSLRTFLPLLLRSAFRSALDFAALLPVTDERTSSLELLVELDANELSSSGDSSILGVFGSYLSAESEVLGWVSATSCVLTRLSL